MTEKTKIRRPSPGHSALAAVALVLSFLAFTISPASAGHHGVGYGEQTHIGVPFQPDPKPCARYTNYVASVAFPHAASGPFAVSVKSPLETNTGTPGSAAGPNSWKEGPSGTFDVDSDCTPGVLDTIGDETGEPGFNVTFADGRTCSDAVGTYLRNVTTITIAGFSCGGVTQLHYTIVGANAIPASAACNSIIAPSMCLIGPRV